MSQEVLKWAGLPVVVSLLLPAAAIGAAVDGCLDAAAAAWEIPPALMRAVAQVESGRNPNALHVNSNGSVDIGLMQINSVHLPELASAGLNAAHLLNPCINAWFGGLLLKRQIRRFGGISVESIGAYHAPHAPRRWPVYTGKIAQALAGELKGGTSANR